MDQLLISYLRVSTEDKLNMDESCSITNQRKIIQRYIKEHHLDTSYQLKEYIDDGYTGRNLERPGIQSVLQHVRDREVAVIIIKDFSRLARDHMIMGDFIDKIFPFMNVRLISINDHYDSDQYKNRTPNLDVPFQNLIYDYYSEETGIKVRKEFEKKRRRGDFFGCIPPFGYMQSGEDHTKLVIDPVAGKLVEWIFQKRLIDNMRKTEISKILNEAGVPTPSFYMKQKGKNNLISYSSVWQGSMISRILHDPVHTGIMINGKIERAATGSRERIVHSKKERVVQWGTHEGNIDFETFFKVQLLDEIDFRYLFENGENEAIPEGAWKFLEQLSLKQVPKGESKKYRLRDGERESPVKGMVFCGCCGHKMDRRKNCGIRYICLYNHENERKKRKNLSILEEDIQNVVLAAINFQISQIGEFRILQEAQAAAEKKLNQENKRRIQACQDKIACLKKLNLEAFEQYHDSKISREQYVIAKNKNRDLQSEAEEELQRLEERIEEKAKRNQFLDLFENKKPVKVLTRELAEEVIDKILVFEDRRIEIVFRNRDELGRLLGAVIE